MYEDNLGGQENITAVQRKKKDSVNTAQVFAIILFAWPNVVFFKSQIKIAIIVSRFNFDPTYLLK